MQPNASLLIGFVQSFVGLPALYTTRCTRLRLRNTRALSSSTTAPAHHRQKQQKAEFVVVVSIFAIATGLTTIVDRPRRPSENAEIQKCLHCRPARSRPFIAIDFLLPLLARVAARLPVYIAGIYRFFFSLRCLCCDPTTSDDDDLLRVQRSRREKSETPRL